MQLPENVQLIAPEHRDQDGLYVIHSGSIHIHRFTIPLLGSVKFEITHAVGGQDHSIRMWMGFEPMNDTIMKPMGLVELDREPLVYEIFDAMNAPENADALPSGQVIYLNIMNRQNSPNNYKLAFVD